MQKESRHFLPWRASLFLIILSVRASGANEEDGDDAGGWGGVGWGGVEKKNR